MEKRPVVKIARLRPDMDGDIPLPQYMTPGSAGMDICAAVDADVTIGTGDIALIPTGFAMQLPPGFEAQIRPRSGLAIKHGVSVANAPGTIDADYRGEVKVGLINLGQADYVIRRGERIAQMVVARVCHVQLQPVVTLAESDRGAGGFGHTGK